MDASGASTEWLRSCVVSTRGICQRQSLRNLNKRHGHPRSLRGSACPAACGRAGERQGVLEFFSTNVGQPDDVLLQVLTGIGSQIAQFAERRQTEEAFRQSEE